MPLALEEGEDEAPRLHLRAALWRTTLPARACPCVPRVVVEHLTRGAPGESLMRPRFVVPREVDVDLSREKPERHRHQDGSERLVLHRADEALDDGDAGVLPDGAEARADATPLAPSTVVVLKLHALIGDDVARRGTDVSHGAIEQPADLFRRGLLVEDAAGDDTSGEVIEDDGDPRGEGQRCARARGSHGIQNPQTMGTTVRSTCQR